MTSKNKTNLKRIKILEYLKIQLIDKKSNINRKRGKHKIIFFLKRMMLK